jgi:tetratricopeptide (TPR) repeat protein
VAYASLPGPRRQALHLAAARALETIHADRLQDVFERLAYHFSKTDHAEKAVEYLTLFARSAATLYAHEEAVRALQEAQLHAQNLPVKDRDRRRLDLVLRHASSLFPLGRIHEILELLLPQREPLARLQDAALAGHYYFLLGRTYSFLADLERAAQNAQRAIAEADRCGDATTKGKAYCLLAQDGPLAGKALEGIAHGRQAVELLEGTEGTEERWWLGHAHWVVALNYLQIGSIGPALGALAQADAIARVTGDPRLQTVAAWCAGIIHAIAGESERAISECRQAVERAPDPLNRAVAVGWLGFAYMEKGDAAEAIPLLEQVAAEFSRFGYRPLQGWFTAFLAEAYRIGGQFDVAREVATKSMQIATDSNVRVAIGWARLSLGRIANAMRVHAEAESHLRTALDTFAGIQSKYEMGRTQMDLAVAAHAQGKVEAATASLREAQELFTALRMPDYVRRAEQLAGDLAIAL